MAGFGLVGPAYQSQSLNADAQACINWYLERDESGQGKSDWQLMPCAGLLLFCTLTDSPNRGGYYIPSAGRLFAVAGGMLFEISALGVVTNRGAVANDGLPVSMVSSRTQLFIASGGNAYCYTLATNALVAVANLVGIPISQVGYSTNRFLALQSNSNTFWTSALNDAATFDPGLKQQVSIFTDNIVSMIVDHQRPWFFGQTLSTPYYNTGSNLTPFSPVPDGFVENGVGAIFAQVKLDNAIFGINSDIRGSGMGFRISGNTFQRISNHAIETEWQSYSTFTDAIGLAIQDQGHSFWQINFPTANKTWVYDVKASVDAGIPIWHQRAWLNPATGNEDAHLAQWHQECFSTFKHLVGDRQSGKIYQMNIPISNGAGGWKFADDNGQAIRRVRRAPHIATEDEFIYGAELQILLETGLGPIPPLLDGAGNPREPQLMMRKSRDGGHAYGVERIAGCGMAGDFTRRARFTQLGRARDWVIEIAVSDPVPWRILGGTFRGSGTNTEFKPSERLSAQMRKIG